MSISSSQPSYCYILRCTTTNKVYVGKSNHPERRFVEHLHAAKSGEPGILYEAIRREGVESFVLEQIIPCNSEYAALLCEKNLIRQYRATDIRYGYNSLKEDGRVSTVASPAKAQRKAWFRILRELFQIVEQEKREPTQADYDQIGKNKSLLPSFVAFVDHADESEVNHHFGDRSSKKMIAVQKLYRSLRKKHEKTDM